MLRVGLATAHQGGSFKQLHCIPVLMGVMMSSHRHWQARRRPHRLPSSRPLSRVGKPVGREVKSRDKDTFWLAPVPTQVCLAATPTPSLFSHIGWPPLVGGAAWQAEDPHLYVSWVPWLMASLSF